MQNDVNTQAGKAGVYYTIGNFLLKGVLFFSLPIFTRIMGTGDFGYYNNYIAYEQIFTAIFGLGMYGTIKNAKIDLNNQFEKYFSFVSQLCFLFTIIVLITANWITYLNGYFLSLNQFETNLLILQSFGAALLYLYGVKLNVEFKYKSYIVYSFFNTIGNVLLSVLLIVYVFPNQRYLGRIIGSACPLIIISIIILSRNVIRDGIFFNHFFLKYAIPLGIPLMPHVLSQSLLNQFDRIMINKMTGASYAGIYSCIYTISTVIQVLAGAVENAWSPWVFVKLNSKLELEVRKKSETMIDMFLMATIGFMCVMPETCKIIIDSKYWDGIPLIFPLSLAMFFAFLYTFPANIEYYHKKTSTISAGTVLCAIINIVLNYVFIGIFGYVAAAFTTAASYLLLFSFHWLIAKTYGISQIYDSAVFLKNSLILIAVSMIFFLTYNCGLFSIFIRYLVCVIAVIRLFKYRKVLIEFFK